MAGYDILALSNLLGGSSKEDDGPSSSAAAAKAAFAPSSGAGVPSKAFPPVAGKAPVPAAAANSGDIWSPSEVVDKEVLITKDDKSDTRKCPKHEVCYKQAVDTGDVFLGLSDKSPGTSDCSHIVVKAYFDGCKMADIDLDVTKNVLKAESKEYKLRVFLPQAVDFDNGNAKFDPKTCILTVTLPILENDWSS